jgi:hypothetical protein
MSVVTSILLGRYLLDSSPRVPGMNRPTAIIYVLAVVVLGAFILLPSDKESDSTTPSVPLNYSKPVFTTSITVVCPMSLLSDIRADHSPEKVVDMFNSIFSSSLLKKLSFQAFGSEF